MNRLGIGIIGAGRMGRLHAQTYRGIPNAEVRVVCDVNPQAAGGAAAIVGAAEVVTDWRAVLERKDVQAVDVCTPERDHAEQVVAAAAAGKHILVEKPLATSVPECEQALQAAEAAGVILMPGHCLRWEPRYNQAYQVVAAGGLGDLQTIYTRRSSLAAAQERLKGRASLPLFLGVHDYDLLRWFTGAEVAKVTAESKSGFLSLQGYPTEDANCALMRLSNGVLAVCELGWLLPDSYYSASDHRLDLVGTKGVVNLASRETGLLVATAGRTQVVDTALAPMVDGRVAGAFFGELAHFVDCVLADRQPMVTGLDGLEAVRIAVAVMESAQTGQSVYLRQ